MIPPAALQYLWACGTFDFFVLKSKVLGQGLDFKFEVSTPAEFALNTPPLGVDFGS